MLEYCRENKGRVKWVVVYAVNRFARSSHDHLATRALLGKLGISLRSVTEQFDESSQGKLMESILASFAQFDNDVRSERTVVGMKAALAAGRWTFKAPPGYLNGNRKLGSSSLILEQERAPLIRQAFETYGSGLHSKQTVLAMVNAAGLRTVKGKLMSKQTFEKMLRNPVYAGLLVVDKWGERRRGDFEALVSQELFDRVQALLDGKRVNVTPRLRSNPDFPLRHFVKCGCCGKPLTGGWSKGRSKLYANYRCQNLQCKGVSITKTDLENGFVEFLERLQPRPEYVKLFNEIVLDVWKERQVQNVTLNASLKHHIEDLNERMERLNETFIYQRAIDRETCGTRSPAHGGRDNGPDKTRFRRPAGTRGA